MRWIYAGRACVCSGVGLGAVPQDWAIAQLRWGLERYRGWYAAFDYWSDACQHLRQYGDQPQSWQRKPWRLL